MKNQSIRAILIKAATFFAIFLFGSAAGVTAMWQYMLHFGVPRNSGNESNRLITDKIAIVNLDEGVTIQDEKINYAKNLSLIWMITFFLRDWKMPGKGTQPVSMRGI